MNKYQISFDLYTSKEYEKILKEKYNKSLSSMYNIIKQHFTNNGFSWIEGSSYQSNEEMSTRKLNSVIDDLYYNNLWLAYFTRDLKRAIIKEVVYDYNNVINNFRDALNEEEHIE